MKQILFLLITSLSILSCSNNPIEVNVMTFNVRNDNPGDGTNSWPYRKEMAAEVIRMYDVDLLGTQEVLPRQMNDLKEQLPGYTAIGVGRQDGKEKGEYCAIFYKNSRFEEVKSGNFWLSETPEVAGSKGWDGACERIATWAILKDKKSKKQVFFINTHLDHVGKQARQEGVSLLLERAKTYSNGLPVIISGDFNAKPESDVIQHVLKDGDFFDSRLIAKKTSGAEGTFNNFGKVPIERRSRIDFIFVNKGISVLSNDALPETLNNIFVSDHVPVVSKVAF